MNILAKRHLACSLLIVKRGNIFGKLLEELLVLYEKRCLFWCSFLVTILSMRTFHNHYQHHPTSFGCSYNPFLEKLLLFDQFGW